MKVSKKARREWRMSGGLPGVKPGPLEEQPVFLTAGPSLQPPILTLIQPLYCLEMMQ